ncbi:MAG: metallopeptidase family protein [Planctomycetota bacterium]|jgi:predicted Zn-dependent protease with MMP-like domain
MNVAERARFDALLEDVLASLPPRLHELLEEAPLIVEDRPSPTLLRELGIDEAQESLCGLHSGVPVTERSVGESPGLPETIHLFREAIVEEAGGWEPFRDDDGWWEGGEEAVAREIRITLLHEIGHHFGLEEDDLAELGYE